MPVRKLDIYRYINGKNKIFLLGNRSFMYLYHIDKNENPFL